jgi:hypothetical protein
MSTIIRNENFLFVIATNAVGKFQIFRTGELVQDVAIDIEDEHSHHFTFDDNNTTHIIHTHT